MKIEQASKETVAYWASRAIQDLVIYKSKNSMVDAEKHLEWALKDVRALLGKKE